tara:strand:- start:813 stop:1220 length:408 start_codon:yes stop_codon:yes gene_type:complete
MPHSLLFVKDFEGVEYLTVVAGRGHFFSGMDPGFRDLSHEDFRGTEYEVGDDFPIDGIATPIALSNYIHKQMPAQDTIRVCVYDLKEKELCASLANMSMGRTRRKRGKGKDNSKEVKRVATIHENAKELNVLGGG